jgi:hypothetical protein
MSIKISENTVNLTQGRKGKITILFFTGTGDPKTALNIAVSQYVQNKPHNQFVEIHSDNDYVRVVVSNINEMIYEDFIPHKHLL